jgi:hypothetical protein
MCLLNNTTNEPSNNISNEEDNNTTNSSPHKIYSFKKVFTMEHLLESAKLCKRNVSWKSSVQNYMRAVQYNCVTTLYDLRTGKFKFQNTNEFDIFERGKERHIKSIKICDRVVQKVLCRFLLLPLFRNSFIYDNCASLKDKGISFAFNRVTAMLQKYYRKYGNKGYVLRYDFSDYFGSIDHQIALKMIAKKVKDKKLLKLISDAMAVYADDEDKRIGIGLGSELSQFIALLYANPIDHMIKDKYKVKFYIRYMDDGLIICEDKQFLHDLLKEIKEMCGELHLKLNDRKTYIRKLDKGFNFLKKRIILTDTGRIIMKISRDSVTRMRRKLKKFKIKVKNGEMSIKDVENAYVSWRGFVKQFNSYFTVKNMDNIYKELYDYIPKSKKQVVKEHKIATDKEKEIMYSLAEDFFTSIDENPYVTYREQYYSQKETNGGNVDEFL